MDTEDERVGVGTKYEGSCNSNGPSGKGIYYYSNGAKKYEGDIINGKFYGYGTYYYEQPNENGYYIKYEGYWENSKRQSSLANNKHNIDYVNNVIVFIGEYNDDKRNGKGTEYNENGKIVYKGSFKDNCWNGFGISYYENGKKASNYRFF